MHHWYRYFLHWENQKMLSLLFFCCKVCGVILANAWYVFSSVFDDQDCNATWEGRRAWGPTRGEINFQQKVISAKFNFWRKQLKYVFIENCPRWSRISVSSVWSLSQATTNWSSTSGQFKLCQPSKIGNSPQILVLFLIPFCQQFAGFTRGRSRTSAHTASAGSNSCHMSSSTQGFIQVANQIQQLCDPLYLLCPMPYTWEGPVCQVAISLNLKNKVLNGHRKMQINLRTPW